MDNCVFCLKNNKITNEIVLENDEHVFVHTPDPVLETSGLIISKRHIKSPFEYTNKEWESLGDIVNKVKNILDKELPNGYNLGWNVGKTAGQEVFHVHLHIIGRFDDEPLSGKGIRAHIKQPENKRTKKL